MIKVAVRMPAPSGDPGEVLADIRALDAAGAEAVLVGGGGAATWILLGAAAALTERLRLWVEHPDAALVLQRISHGRVVEGWGEGWVEVPAPRDRDSWAKVLAAQEAVGAEGVIVDWDPRLIDLLRNPEPDDRGDLMMSTG